ncbi:DUF695 domain-containing protein [Lysobacter sp. MMG2]|uniref:DUF695 domain-containing protein n=1 Tax=Lysobacter sp. MMG2 TaxID=2801338 RepID=UPI001C23D0FD|nr:DUF695 domain-containing protein [Lysobacter sp. MMG2]MBU8975379.1 DUF695 domain-containing protein [Lysobacter sp. MMG2]
MKHLLLVGLMLLPMAPAKGATPMTVAQIVAADRWTLAEGECEGHPLFLRFREDFREHPDVSAYPHLMRVVWHYAPNAAGMPDRTASEQMGVFEDWLIAAVEPDQTAVLAAVITHDGDRQWLFYGADVRAFARALRAIPQGDVRLPIDVTTERDPDWTNLHEGTLSGLAG